MLSKLVLWVSRPVSICGNLRANKLQMLPSVREHEFFSVLEQGDLSRRPFIESSLYRLAVSLHIGGLFEHTCINLVVCECKEIA